MVRTLLLTMLLTMMAVTAAHASCALSMADALKIKLLDGLPLHAASNSMYPTEPIGKMFIAHTYHAEGPKPARGDIVAFCLQKDSRTIYIKRIIGIPGDRVQMINDEVVLNGVKLPRTPSGTGNLEDFHNFPCFEERLADRAYRVCQIGPNLSVLSNTNEVTVSAGELFVLGDNRDNSVDSRLPDQMGAVLIDNLIGFVIPDE